MTINASKCPHCGKEIPVYRNPLPTVDIIVEIPDGKVILIKRKNPPPGWALPGGFVDWGESLEEAAIRELKEETNLSVTSLIQMRTYSRPDRDPRFHTITTVFIAQAEGIAFPQDDACEIGFFPRENLPQDMAFDHREILNDYFNNPERSVSDVKMSYLP